MKMVKISFRSFLCILILCVATGFCFAQEASDPLERANKLYEEFNKTGLIHDTEVLQAVNEIQNQLPGIIQSQEEEQLFVLYLQYGLLLSSYYMMGTNHLLPMIEEFDGKIDAILKDSSFSAEIYLAYADYLYSKMPWSQDAMSIVQTLPILYRRALAQPSTSENKRTEALTKLALWHASPADANTSHWNAFIEAQEKNIELLSAVDRFNGYLTMSMYYMRTYQIEKAWDYLSEAQAIFPDNILTAIIRDNYSRGVFSWQG